MEIYKKDLRCGLLQMRKAVGPYYMAYMRNMRWKRLNCFLAKSGCCLRFWKNFDEFSNRLGRDRGRISNAKKFDNAVYTDAWHVAFTFCDAPEGSAYWHSVAKAIKEMEEGEI